MAASTQTFVQVRLWCVKGAAVWKGGRGIREGVNVVYRCKECGDAEEEMTVVPAAARWDRGAAEQDWGHGECLLLTTYSVAKKHWIWRKTWNIYRIAFVRELF